MCTFVNLQTNKNKTINIVLTYFTTRFSDLLKLLFNVVEIIIQVKFQNSLFKEFSELKAKFCTSVISQTK